MLLWNIAFDDLLKLFNRGRVNCVGFADDACLIITGKDLPTMYNLMNKAIGKAIAWATSYGLEISKEKTVAMLFTNEIEYSTRHLEL